MGSSGDIVYRIVDAAGGAVLGLGQSFATEAQITALAHQLGWQLDTVPAPLTALGSTLAAIGPAVIAARADPTNPAPWITLIEGVATGATAIEALSSGDMGAQLAALNFGPQIAKQLVQWAVIEHMRREFPRVLGVLRAAGIVVAQQVDPGAGRVPYTDEHFALPDFDAVLSSPAGLLKAAWAWGSTDFDATTFLDAIAGAFRSAGVTSGYMLEPASAPELSGQDIGTSRWRLVTRLLIGSSSAGEYELGLRWLVVTRDALPALAIVPYVTGTLAASVPFGANLTLAITGMATAGDQRALVISPLSIAFIDNFLDGGTTSGAGAELSVALTPTTPTPIVLTAGSAATITLGAWTLAVVTSFGESGSDIALELSFASPSFAVATSSSGLLTSAGAGGSTVIPIPIKIGVSARRGVYLGDSGRSVPALGPITLGPVQLRNTAIGVAGVDSGFAITLTCNALVTVGPVTITIAGLGAGLTATFPGSGGNLGPVDLDADAVPPTGGAISIQSVVANGGGGITHVSGRDYRGALVLDVLGVHVAAIGVLDDTPTGAGAFVVIAGTSFPGIQLGWGFTLDGIGGVIGTHRSIDTDEIRANLARGAASSLLDFDLGNGDIIGRVDALAAAFPATPGRFVVGPTARLGWGTPRVLQADLAILLELPDPIELVLLGAIQLGLPTLTTRVCDLRVDMLGVIDFARDTLAFDATLHDSKLAGYPITGALALRMSWGDDATFLFAIGGFHPHFTPPPSFPTLPRLQLTAGDNPQLQLQAYLALTSNTAQVGAQAALAYKGGGFTISAQAGFDALFVFSPFQFDVEINASAAISWHGHNLASIALDLELTGPHPWHAVGTASFGILWWSVSVGFDSTWGDATPDAIPAPPDVASTLRAALGSADAWSSQLPADAPAWLVLAPTANSSALHPLGTAIVRESVLPLGLSITEFGNTPLPAAEQFAIASVTIGSTTATTTPVTGEFAPGQFTQLTADQRLAAPSFEEFQAGVAIGAGAITTGSLSRAALETETIEIDPLAPPPVTSPPPRTVIQWTLANALEAVRKPVALPARSGPQLADIRYVTASTSTLAASAAATSFAAARSTVSAGLQVIAAAHAA